MIFFFFFWVESYEVVSIYDYKDTYWLPQKKRILIVLVVEIIID